MGEYGPATEARLRQARSVTDTALAQPSLQDLFTELLERIRELLQVDTAAIMLLDHATQELVATAARGIEEEVRHGVRLPVGAGFAGRVAAQRRAAVVDHPAHQDLFHPHLVQKGIRSLLGVPLLSGDKVIGVLHVGTLANRRFTEEDIDLLQFVADQAADAAQARLSGIERAATLALQRSLLPARLPVVPGLELAARYVPAELVGVGGDWYDLFTHPSGWLCVVMGDVVGHGLAAAVAMGRLRSALRAYALDYDDPAQVLEKLDRKVQHFDPDVMATVLYAMFEPTLERVHLSVAGHPPPVLALPGRPATVLDLPPDVPIGVVPMGIRAGIRAEAAGRWRRRTSIIDLPPGALMCCYTDGLIERPGTSLDDGLARLCDALVAGPADDVCTQVMATLIGTEPPHDDIALLTARRTTPSATD